MRVALFATCLVDQCWPEAGLRTAALLRHYGCDVRFDPDQTCCGQPAANTGYRGHAQALARRTITVLERDPTAAVVVPSGSCAAMLRHFPDLLADDPDFRERAESLARRTWELSGFLVHALRVDAVPGRLAARAAWHDACHGLRELGVRDEPRRLLGMVPGLELRELTPAETCCGFGGTFSVKLPDLSVAIADQKVDSIQRAGVDAVVSGDVSCLMQIEGRLRRRGVAVRALHLAEVLAAGVAG